MKRISVMSSWMIFAIGIPTVLILNGFTPTSSLIGIKFNLLAGNSEKFVLHLASTLLWSIWLYALFAFNYDLWQLKFHNVGPKASFGLRRWITMCASVVGSLILASHASASPHNSSSADTNIDDFRNQALKTEVDHFKLPSLAPLVLTASTVLVTGVLQLVRLRREKVLRDAVPHSQIQPLSHRSQSTLAELRLAAATTNCDVIRAAMNTLMASESAPILASWRPDTTPKTVLQRSECKMGVPPLCCVPLGLVQGEIFLLTLSCGDTISVNLDDGCQARSVLAHLAHAIVLETIESDTRVIVCGFTAAELIDAPHLSVVNLAENLVEFVSNTGASNSTIVCSADPLSSEILNQLRGVGCCVVAASIDFVADVALVHTQHGWNISPTKQLISLYGITLDESKAVSKLVNEVARPATIPSVPEHLTTPLGWKIIVRILGPVEVMTRGGLSVRFERSKSVELLAWLTTHRSRQSRSAARTALWEVNVQAATFTNVVSDVRRSIGKVIPQTENEEWLPRTLTDALPLHLSITTDGELLDASIHRAESMDNDAALAELRNALEYVRDLPFSGSNYLWPDAEGITTQLTLSVMTSAVMASELYLERGDIEGVFWATGRGLKVLPGHEELLALRMRAHALKGDLAAVRAEWSSHQRAIARDVWSGGATSPKLNELCRELLRQPHQDIYSVSE